MTDNESTMQELIDESIKVDEQLQEKHGEAGGFLSTMVSLGVLVDHLERAGIINKRDLMIDSINSRRAMLKDDH